MKKTSAIFSLFYVLSSTANAAFFDWQKIFNRPAKSAPSVTVVQRSTQSSQPKVLNDFEKKILDWGPRMENIMGARAEEADAPVSCTQVYKAINDSGKHRIVIGFGYTDWTPGARVSDPEARAALTDYLLRPCSENASILCGFKPVIGESGVIAKRVRSVDGLRSRRIEIKMVNGALTTNHDINTSPENLEKQMALCAAAKAQFESEVAGGADTVIYFGHSRNGGGPDFCPPVRTADGRHVNYPYYMKKREGINGLTQALKMAKKLGKEPSLVALLSCASELHFKRRLSQNSPNVGLILTDAKVDFWVILHDLLATLASSIEQTCKEPIQAVFDEAEWKGVHGFSHLFNFMKEKGDRVH